MPCADSNAVVPAAIPAQMSNLITLLRPSLLHTHGGFKTTSRITATTPVTMGTATSLATDRLVGLLAASLNR